MFHQRAALFASIGLIIACAACLPFAGDALSDDVSASTTPVGGCDSSFQCPLWQNYSCVARTCVPKDSDQCIDRQDGEGPLAEQSRDYSSYVPGVLQYLKNSTR